MQHNDIRKLQLKRLLHDKKKWFEETHIEDETPVVRDNHRRDIAKYAEQLSDLENNTTEKLKLLTEAESALNEIEIRTNQDLYKSNEIYFKRSDVNEKLNIENHEVVEETDQASTENKTDEDELKNFIKTLEEIEDTNKDKRVELSFVDAIGALEEASKNQEATVKLIKTLEAPTTTLTDSFEDESKKDRNVSEEVKQLLKENAINSKVGMQLLLSRLNHLTQSQKSLTTSSQVRREKAEIAEQISNLSNNTQQKEEYLIEAYVDLEGIEQEEKNNEDFAKMERLKNNRARLLEIKTSEEQKIQKQAPTTTLTDSFDDESNKDRNVPKEVKKLVKENAINTTLEMQLLLSRLNHLTQSQKSLTTSSQLHREKAEIAEQISNLSNNTQQKEKYLIEAYVELKGIEEEEKNNEDFAKMEKLKNNRAKLLGIKAFDEQNKTKKTKYPNKDESINDESTNDHEQNAPTVPKITVNQPLRVISTIHLDTLEARGDIAKNRRKSKVKNQEQNNDHIAQLAPTTSTSTTKLVSTSTTSQVQHVLTSTTSTNDQRSAKRKSASSILQKNPKNDDINVIIKQIIRYSRLALHTTNNAEQQDRYYDEAMKQLETLKKLGDQKTYTKEELEYRVNILDNYYKLKFDLEKIFFEKQNRPSKPSKQTSEFKSYFLLDEQKTNNEKQPKGNGSSASTKKRHSSNF